MNQHDSERYFDITRRLATLASESKDVHLLVLLIENHKLLTGARPLSRNTLRAYQKALTDFLAHTDHRPHLHQVTQEDIEQYVDSMENSRPVNASKGGRGRTQAPHPLSRNTVIQRLTAVRNIFSAFTWVGLCKFNPASSIHRSRATTPASRHGAYYRNSELAALLKFSSIHDACFLLLATHGGLRASELNNLTWQDISLVNHTMHVRGTRPGAVHLSNKLVLSLLELRAEQQERGALPEFVLSLRTQTGLYRRLQNLCIVSGVTFKGVQALRNTCGKNLLAVTGDARTVQQHLRLRSLEQVQYFAGRTTPLSETIAALDF